MGSKFYAVRVTAGQEENIIAVASLRIESQDIAIKALLAPPSLKGTIIVEAENIGDVNTALGGIRHVKKIIYGNIKPEEVERLITAEEKVEEFNVGDEVEVVSGPFKDLRARIVRAEKEKREVVIEFLDALVSLKNIYMPKELIRPIKKRKA